MPPRRQLYRLSRSCLVSAGAVVIMGACASIETHSMQCVVDSWMASPIEAVQAQWGPPEKVQSVPQGTAYVWHVDVLRPPPPRDLYPAPDIATAPIRCERRLITGTDGRVVAGAWNGEGCCFTTLIGRCAAWLRVPTPGAAA